MAATKLCHQRHKRSNTIKHPAQPERVAPKANVGLTTAMLETFVDITTPDGQMNTFIVHPDEGGPHPLVLFLMDAPGMREEIRDMSRRLASAGYYVLASHLYYRDVTEFNVFETGDRDRMHELMDNLSNAIVVEDARAMIDHAAQDPAADTSRIGTVGYCMSGPFTIAIAAAFPQVRAAASIHGVRLATDGDDSPHRLVANTDAEIYIAAAETDSWAPPEIIDTFDQALKASPAHGRVEWFPGTEHGFAFRERPLYNKAASETHWQRLHDLFRRNLHA